MGNNAYVKEYFADVSDILKDIDVKEIGKAIDILFDAWKKDRNVFFMGCGGSAGTASHFAADLSKTAIVDGKKRFRAHSLVDNPSLVSAWVNDEGWESVFVGQLENLFQEGDVAVALSVHGGSGKGNAGQWSQNLTKALQYVKDGGGKNVGFAGFDGGAFRQLCDACVIVPKDSTPQVEGFHGVLQHLIIFRLKELIANYKG